eukprot:scaffold1135_cov343-Prasinococcus_capsulatus_cf.AAC.9
MSAKPRSPTKTHIPCRAPARPCTDPLPAPAPQFPILARYSSGIHVVPAPLPFEPIDATPGPSCHGRTRRSEDSHSLTVTLKEMAPFRGPPTMAGSALASLLAHSLGCKRRQLRLLLREEASAARHAPRTGGVRGQRLVAALGLRARCAAAAAARRKGRRRGRWRWCSLVVTAREQLALSRAVGVCNTCRLLVWTLSRGCLQWMRRCGAAGC